MGKLRIPMKILQAITQATVDVADTTPQKDLPALADAVLRLLDRCGLSHKRAVFFRLLRRTLTKEKAALPLALVTASGDAGTHGASIASLVHQTLRKPVELEESANPALLGGALIAYGDERFDASLRGSLTSLHRHLSSPLSYDPQ